ncbi:MAG: hypothetical protein ABIR54_22575 [Burkholderiaceae bacterium]
MPLACAVTVPRTVQSPPSGARFGIDLVHAKRALETNEPVDTDLTPAPTPAWYASVGAIEVAAWANAAMAEPA